MPWHRIRGRPEGVCPALGRASIGAAISTTELWLQIEYIYIHINKNTNTNTHAHVLHLSIYLPPCLASSIYIYIGTKGDTVTKSSDRYLQYCRCSRPAMLLGLLHLATPYGISLKILILLLYRLNLMCPLEVFSEYESSSGCSGNYGRCWDGLVAIGIPATSASGKA